MNESCIAWLPFIVLKFQFVQLTTDVVLNSDLPIDIISTSSCRPTSSDISAANDPQMAVAIIGVPVCGFILDRNLKQR